jgi:hypothetical protein
MNYNSLTKLQIKKLIAIRDWALDSVINEIETPVMFERDYANKNRRLKFVESVLKVSRAIGEMEGEANQIVVLPTFGMEEFGKPFLTSVDTDEALDS